MKSERDHIFVEVDRSVIRHRISEAVRGFFRPIIAVAQAASTPLSQEHLNLEHRFDFDDSGFVAPGTISALLDRMRAARQARSMRNLYEFNYSSMAADPPIGVSEKPSFGKRRNEAPFLSDWEIRRLRAVRRERAVALTGARRRTKSHHGLQTGEDQDTRTTRPETQ